METIFRKLRSLIVLRGKKIQEISVEMGLHPASLGQKITNERITVKQLVQVMKILDGNIELNLNDS